MEEEQIQTAVRMILEAIGENPDREELLDTPRRVASLYKEIFSGLGMNPADELATLFHEGHHEMVLVKNIPFYSMCEHHLIPFFGKAHVAYIPNGDVITGLSKLARLVEVTARRLQLQERLTAMIADALVDQLEPQGVAVMVEAEHLCMAMRGVNKPGTLTITTAVRGIYERDAVLRQEVFALFK